MIEFPSLVLVFFLPFFSLTLLLCSPALSRLSFPHPSFASTYRSVAFYPHFTPQDKTQQENELMRAAHEAALVFLFAAGARGLMEREESQRDTRGFQETSRVRGRCGAVLERDRFA